MGLKGFVEGGVASVTAACTTHPLDLIKVRMQLHGEAPLAPIIRQPAFAFPFPNPTRYPPPRRPGPISVGVRILRSEGPAALYSGISASVLRQALYSTTTMGLYDSIKAHWAGDDDSRRLPLHRKIAAGLVSGAIGAAVGNPADVAMVRMQADGRLRPCLRRNYSSAADAIARMARDEGLGSLWRGSGLTVKRAMIVSASQLATYDQAKEAIARALGRADDGGGGGGGGGGGLGTHVAASLAAGVVAAAASTPVDVVKTRVMNMKVEKGAAPPYAGALDCAVKTVRAEGPMALYKGFVPTVSRQGPFTVVLFVTLEQVRKLLGDF